MAHFVAYISALDSGALSIMLVIYDLYCQSKLLIKIQLSVMQLGIGFFFPFSGEGCIHTEQILVVIMKYEVTGPSVIVIICHSNFSMMVQWSNWKQPSAGAITQAARVSYKLTKAFLPEMQTAPQICTGPSHQTLWMRQTSVSYAGLTHTRSSLPTVRN